LLHWTHRLKNVISCYLIGWRNMIFLDELWIFFFRGGGPFLLELLVLFSFTFPFFHGINFFSHFSYP
jgi:hypothetical protein